MSCEHISRCSGDCCKRFYLPLTPDELKYEATREDRYEKIRFNPKEMEQIYGMVIALAPSKDSKVGVDGFSAPPESGWYYTCKNFDTQTGNCLIYETRPDMCRDYPFYGEGYRNRCTYENCTWEEARNPPVKIRLQLKKLTHEAV